MNDDAKQLLLAQEQKRSEQFALAMAVAMRILSARALTLIALVLQTVIFGWAMAEGGWDRLATATLFAIGSWFLVNYRKGGSNET